MSLTLCWEASVTASHESQHLRLCSVLTQPKIPRHPRVFQFFHLSERNTTLQRGQAENSVYSLGFEPEILMWHIQVPPICLHVLKSDVYPINSCHSATKDIPLKCDKTGSECGVADALLDTEFASGGRRHWRSGLHPRTNRTVERRKWSLCVFNFITTSESLWAKAPKALLAPQVTSPKGLLKLNVFIYYISSFRPHCLII